MLPASACFSKGTLALPKLILCSDREQHCRTTSLDSRQILGNCGLLAGAAYNALYCSLFKMLLCKVVGACMSPLVVLLCRSQRCGTC